MANKSSSVFGGPTSRWELGGNPSVTMFSKPSESTKPVEQPAPPVETSVVAEQENLPQSEEVSNVASTPQEQLYIRDLEKIFSVVVAALDGIITFENGDVLYVPQHLAAKLITLLDQNKVIQ